jgi:hypothetical protein
MLSAAAPRVGSGAKLASNATNHLPSYLAADPTIDSLQIRIGEKVSDLVGVETTRGMASVALGLIPTK